MQLKALHLHNFRLYVDRAFLFGEGVNAIYGNNGQGKTALLEAIYLLITGRSFRSARLSELIRHGASYLRVEAHFNKHSVEQKLVLWSDGKQRRVFYNGNPCASPTALLGIIRGGLLTPEDIALIKGAPAGRRLFLDMNIAQTDPIYVHNLLRYNRALLQRNTLLRRKSDAAITMWEEQMASAAAYLVRQRRQTLAELQHQLTVLQGDVEAIQIKYCCCAPEQADTLEALKAFFSQELARQRAKELLIGFSLIGPHKEDLALSNATGLLKAYGSEGQQRASVAMLRLAEWHNLKILGDQTPLMLLDDAWLGLDLTHRRRQAQQMAALGQVFFTATESLPLAAAHEIFL